MNRTILVLAAAGLFAAPIASLAQAPAAKKPAAAAARKAPAASAYRATVRVGGHPDLSGVWKVMNTANWNIEPHAASSALMMRPGPVVPVPAREVLALGAITAIPAGLGVVEGGLLPYTPKGRAEQKDNQANYITWAEKGTATEHLVTRDPETKCYLPGVPRANYMDHPFKIFHSDKAMLFAYEYAGATRNILFGNAGPAPIDSWMGQSVGKWEGDTLVVTVTGQLDSTWFDRAGNHHSGDMIVVERYTPLSPMTMRYEAQITDPQTFSRPWKMSMILYKLQGEDAQLQQFKCVEFVEELIYGHLRKTPLH